MKVSPSLEKKYGQLPLRSWYGCLLVLSLSWILFFSQADWTPRIAPVKPKRIADLHADIEAERASSCRLFSTQAKIRTGTQSTGSINSRENSRQWAYQLIEKPDCVLCADRLCFCDNFILVCNLIWKLYLNVYFSLFCPEFSSENKRCEHKMMDCVWTLNVLAEVGQNENHRMVYLFEPCDICWLQNLFEN